MSTCAIFRQWEPINESRISLDPSSVVFFTQVIRNLLFSDCLYHSILNCSQEKIGLIGTFIIQLAYISISIVGSLLPMLLDPLKDLMRKRFNN